MGRITRFSANLGFLWTDRSLSDAVRAANPDLPFCNGVLVGDTFYVAGHLGLDPNTGQAPADPKREAELLLDDFAKTLGAVGMNMDDLVRAQVFCSDVGLYQTFNDVYRRRFAGPFPARAFLGSGTLLRGNTLFGIGPGQRDGRGCDQREQRQQ